MPEIFRCPKCRVLHDPGPCPNCSPEREVALNTLTDADPRFVGLMVSEEKFTHERKRRTKAEAELSQALVELEEWRSWSRGHLDEWAAR